MAHHPDFPKSPYATLDPSTRWFPGEEDLFTHGYEKLLPPLVAKLRKDVHSWRNSGYEGAGNTSKALLKWWFHTEHPVLEENQTYSYFRYYFAQQEAVETVIYLYEVAKIKNGYDLMRYDSSGAVSTSMFYENWKRFVIKMATGSGKTKVLSLLLAWSYFHKQYEEESQLARNFLLITPNIIVLDRIRTDFEGLKIFHEDPILPENGYEGQNWQDDFQLTVHIQDEIGTVRKNGNIFLTNIHRVYDNSYKEPSFQDEDLSDYFLGRKPTGATSDSKVDLSDVVRDIDELVILNDEAHHIHDERLAWFKSIQDINNRLVMKGFGLSLQIDVTATPKHNNGSIFVQTISDYPLVEAIYQDVVKHPVLPDSASRVKLIEKQSSKYSEKYEDYIHLGYLEWKKVYDEQMKMGKKAVLFIMTDDTKNCDEVAEFLESRYAELKDSVLVIHTKNNGEISEASTGKGKEELELLRKAANEVDKFDNKYKAIVSVLMLKEGWDVRNVTTIVGLRPYNSKSNILPEQTLGRGLRRMYRGENVTELVSVVGTDAFMDFVESIKTEGVELETREMGEGSGAKSPLIIEIDKDNTKKDLEKLDIEIPVLTPRIYREFKNISELEPGNFGNKKFKVIQFSDEEQREIVFRDIATDEITHTTQIETAIAENYQNVIGYFARAVMKDLRLFSGYDVLYGKLKDFILNHLFEGSVLLDNLNILRNLSEPDITKTIIETFKIKINELTVLDKGEAEIRDSIRIGNTRPFVAKEQGYIMPKRSVFNRIIGDKGFELKFAAFLDSCEDIISFAKNYLAVHFKIDYKTSAGDLSNYYPDFIVKKTENEIYIIETKGLEDLDAPVKFKRLLLWCEDLNSIQKKKKYIPLYIEQEKFEKYTPDSFNKLISTFIDEGK